MSAKASFRRPSDAALSVLIALAGALAVAFLMKGKYYSISSDLALHYELAHLIRNSWMWPTSHFLASGMQQYPPAAHYLAAIFGLPFHSTLIGLNVVACLAVFGCYLLLAETVTVGSTVGALVALVIAGAGLSYGRTQYAVEGYEVFYNFFFSQMVGEFLFIAFTLWLCRTQRDWKVRLSISCVVTILACWLYAISAVEIALACICLETIFLLRRIRQTRSLELTWLIPAVLGAAILPVLVALNPKFHEMVLISHNNGGLGLIAFEHLVPELAALLLILATALGVFAPDTPRWRRGTLVLATAGCATAAAALAQTAALDIFGAGSPYAVKKYGFSIITLLIFSLGALAATAVEKRGPRQTFAAPRLCLPTAFALGAALMLPNHSPQPLDKFVKYQKQVSRIASDPTFPRDAWGNTVSHNNGFGWYLNHAVTMVDLGMSQNRSMAAAQSTLNPAQPMVAAYALVNDPSKDTSERCVRRFSSDPSIAFIDLRCDRKNLAQTISFPAHVDLARAEFVPRFFTHGWYDKEPAGMWSEGNHAEMAMHFDNPPRTVLLSMEISAFIPKPGYVQHVRLHVGKTEVGHWTFDVKSSSGLRQVELPRNLLQNGDLKLEFELPDATSPTVQGISGDSRVIGIFVDSFTIAGNGLA